MCPVAMTTLLSYLTWWRSTTPLLDLGPQLAGSPSPPSGMEVSAYSDSSCLLFQAPLNPLTYLRPMPSHLPDTPAIRHFTTTTTMSIRTTTKMSMKCIENFWKHETEGHSCDVATLCFALYDMFTSTEQQR